MILIATICIIALVAVMVVFGRIYESEYSSFAGLVSVVSCIAVFCMAIVFFRLAFDWFAAEQKANIINREYRTAYTQKEIFYAEDVIDTIREIDRSRIEVNGSLFKED